jgi:hypothetical protein
MILARGSGWRATNTVKRTQVSRFVLVRFQHPLGVVVGREGRHEVIGKPHQGRLPAQARSHLFFEPPVQHMVQEDVREDQ